ncbi:MAG: hypothetical protein ACLFVX_06235 [Archaeoglobaceae archaeon]
MFDKLEKRQFYGLIAGFVVVAVIAFGAGAALGGVLMGSSGPDPSGATVSEEEIRQNVQAMMDQQVQQQEQQLALLAQQSENISEEDLSIDASVKDVSSSQFSSLYKVTIAVTGIVPSQTGELEPIDQEQEMYISKDGRYLFQQPIDLEQPQQPTGME